MDIWCCLEENNFKYNTGKKTFIFSHGTINKNYFTHEKVAFIEKYSDEQK